MEKTPLKKIDLLVGAFLAFLFILLSFQSFSVFESLGRVVYSVQMRLDSPRNPGANVVAIVNIDDKSIKQLGPWPWPRQLIAEMINILKNNGAKLIALELLFSEKERNLGLQEIRELQKAIEERSGTSTKDPSLLKNLSDIESRLDSDRLLIKAVKEGGIIYLPLIGSFGKYDTELVLPEDSFLKKNSLKTKAPFAGIVPVGQLAVPFSELAENSRGLGHINLPPNKASQGQTHLLFIDYRSNIIPSMPFRLSLDFLNKKAEEAIVPGKGIKLKDTLIPASNGELLIKFKGTGRSFPYYSFVDILNVKKVPAVFDGKIVLIGYTAEDAPKISTPVDPELPQVELTANVIDNMLNGRYLVRPSFMIYIEAVFILLLCLFTSFLMSRYGFINRMGITATLIKLSISLWPLSLSASSIPSGTLW
ncbi:MAG: CHASE2 domain-containing protein [Deltaproteobacteria bacterium]|nr:CHASE2 domain-containing protein [Deltaproteobacteria bacterium]